MNEKVKLSGILFLGLILRLKGLFSPILDLYPMRQEQGAMIARNFFRHGYRLFYPEVDWYGNLASYWSIELPIISYITALLYKFFGIHEFLGRLVAISFSLGSIYFLYKLVKLYFDEKTAFFAALFFAISPMNVYFSRVFMPEPVMLFFSIAMLYYFSLWINTEKLTHFLLAALSTSLAFLAKASTLFLGLPLLFLSWIKFKKRLFWQGKLWIFLFVSLIPSLWWYQRSPLAMQHFTNPDVFWSCLLNHEFYKRLFESFGILILTPVGISLFTLGLLLKVSNKKQYFFHIWFLSLLIYLVVFSPMNRVHYYYQLPFVPIMAVFVGRAFSFFIDRDITRFTIFAKYIKTKLLVWITLGLILAISVVSARPLYRWNAVTYDVARYIEKSTPRDAIIIAGRSTHQALLYYCDRKGWEINELGQLSYDWGYKGEKLIDATDEISLVEALIAHGADYYAATDMASFNKNPDLVNYMRSNFKILKEGEGFVIFDLNQRI